MGKIRNMATKKKTNTPRKQSVSGASPRSYSDLYKGDKTRPTQAVTTSTRKAVVSEPSAEVQTLDWRQEYGHVASDLRMLGIVSGLLFGIIIISGFFF